MGLVFFLSSCFLLIASLGYLAGLCTVGRYRTIPRFKRGRVHDPSLGLRSRCPVILS